MATVHIEVRSADVFDVLLQEPLRKGRKEAQINGLSLGFSSFILMATNALIFWFGAKKVDEFSSCFCAFVSGYDEKLQIHTPGDHALQVSCPKSFRRCFSYAHVFEFPPRPEINVLKHYNLTIEPGQTVAFCGPSKQRIAIARAILKNPNILLLDEATSALDSESEKVVQEALDKVVALKRRTTIVIVLQLSNVAQVTMSLRQKSPHETPYAALLTPRGSFNNAKTSKLHTHNDDHGLPFLSLYRFATAADKLQLVLGAIMAGLNGAIFPCMALLLTPLHKQMEVSKQCISGKQISFLIAIALFITDCLAYILFCNSAEKQMKALRAHVFTHMLYMDVSWYDRSDAFELTSRITGDTVKIKDGMGQKLGDSIKFTCQFFVGYIIGFARGWDMSLVMACVMPIMVLSLKYMVRLFRKRAVLSQKMYAEAGAVAEETLGSIRTVASLNGEKRAIEKYNERAVLVETGNIAISKRSACVFGCMMGSIWLMYAAGLWYGGSKVAKAEASPGTVFQAFFGVLMGTISLSQISPNITAVAEAKGAAAEIYKILDTQSAINASNEDEGDRPDSCVGRIQALGVNFTYPSRPDVQILNDYNVTIEPGQTVAFVGASGGGKSTLISLLERFYDPQEGTILLDGRDVKTLNVKWLRSQIGLVSQEPVLFATTIFENIAAGANGITRDEVVAAAKLANAHTFIMSLPEQYDTLVGEKGVSLSGGQKQRVAIARAILREPKILVLDEATSALDNESERVVQAALNNLMDKTRMTTLVIAHRLSTIRRADKIVVVNAGHVVEEGSHDELVAIEHGIYQNLYRIQEEKNQEEAEAAANALLQAGNDGAVKMPRKLSSRSIGSECLPGNAALKEIQDSATEGKFTIVDALEFSRPERKFFVTGLIAAGINGFSMPCSAILISEMVA
ncbi:Multidrug resistance protein ABC Superfamily, partial [Phytophthora palmivora]